MTARDAFSALWDELNRVEENDICDWMIEMLANKNSDLIRAAALEHTDLVEQTE